MEGVRARANRFSRVFSENPARLREAQQNKQICGAAPEAAVFKAVRRGLGQCVHGKEGRSPIG